MPLDESKLRIDEARARKAKGLIEDELLTEAFSTLEAAYIKAWRETSILDVSGREKLFLAVNVIGKVKDHLAHVLDNGKVAAKELADIAKLNEPPKRFWAA